MSSLHYLSVSPILRVSYVPYVLRVLRVLCVLCFLTGTIPWLAASRDVKAQASKGLTTQERRGKEIYLKGESSGGEIIATLGNGELELPAGSFPCSNCHGLKGEGSKEGGLRPTPLDWRSLSSPGQSPLTRNDRGPYTDDTLARSINRGLDSSGGRLHPGMPRYKMASDQMRDLIAYLKKIGSSANADPGLTDDAIKMGAALPMSGELARVGEDIRAALAACFADVNSRGGIYGRRVELVVEDSKGDAAGTAQATRKLVEQGNVFALLGSFEPQNCDETNEFLGRSEVTLIGPVTLSPRLPVVPNRFVFYLLPSFGDQARSLVDFVRSQAARPKGRPASRIAVLYADGDFDQDALAGLRSQAKLYSMQIVSEQSYKAGSLSSSIVSSIAPKQPDYVFFFGGAADIGLLAAEMERASLHAGLLSSAVMIGRAAFNLPAAIAQRTYLAYPFSLPGEADFADFVAVMKKGGVTLRSPAFQSAAYAAAKIFIEAAKNADRQLTRDSLLNSLERLQDFETGVIGPVTFGPNRRVGATGSYIVGIDSIKKEYVPVSDRIVPGNAPR
ncbi:MAG TPA: ABC transporter substrate-binding protein [Blastocatellia bacterium]|nr:ABC transporter substrate-binding protein [Blastocatellia bacterium]